MAYGMIEIDGHKYLERFQVLPFDLTVTVALGLMQNQRLVLPGTAPFLLKALTRETIAAGAPAARAFKFKFGNTDGGLQYSAAGIGLTNDRVVDTLMFGNGQFPFVVFPHIIYGMNSAITYEVEDLSNNVPYTISFALHGSFLLPV